MISTIEPQNTPFSRVMDGHFPTAYQIAMPDSGLEKIGIYRNDRLLVVPRHRYEQGDVVAVRIGGRIYVRRYFSDERYIYLEPANGNTQRLSIEPTAPGIQLLGCVTRVLPASA